MNACPSCGSERTRLGGRAVWSVYVGVILAGVVAVFAFELHAGLVAGVMIALVVLANLVFGTRVCLDCGTEWKIELDR